MKFAPIGNDTELVVKAIDVASNTRGESDLTWPRNNSALHAARAWPPNSGMKPTAGGGLPADWRSHSPAAAYAERYAHCEQTRDD